MNLGRYIMDIRNKELKNKKEFIMKHAIATFIFVDSIAGFGEFANALPIASTTGADASKSVALDQGANQWNHYSNFDKKRGLVEHCSCHIRENRSLATPER